MNNKDTEAITPQNSFSDAELNRHSVGIPRYNVQPFKGIVSAPPTLQTTPVYSPAPQSERSMDGKDVQGLVDFPLTPDARAFSQDARNAGQPSRDRDIISSRLRNRLYDQPLDSGVLKAVNKRNVMVNTQQKNFPRPPENSEPGSLHLYRTTMIRNKTSKLKTQEANATEASKTSEVTSSPPQHEKHESKTVNTILDVNANLNSLKDWNTAQERMTFTRDQYQGDDVLSILYKLRKRLCWQADGILEGDYPTLKQDRSIDTQKMLPKDDDGEFVYCLPKDHDIFTARYNPYNLYYASPQMVKSCDIYFTVTASYVTRVASNSEPLLTSVKDWLHEKKMFQRIYSIPLFAKFRLWKAFNVWQKNIRNDKKEDSRDVISRLLYTGHPVMLRAIQEIRSICESICETSEFLSMQKQKEISLLSLDRLSVYCLEDFCNDNMKQATKAWELLEQARQQVIDIIRNACQYFLEEEKLKIQAGEEMRREQIKSSKKSSQHQSKSMQVTKAKYGLAEKKEISSKKQEEKLSYKYTQRAQLKTVHHTLRSFIRYIDFILMDMLRRLVTNAVKEILDHFRSSSGKKTRKISAKVVAASWVEERERQKRIKLDNLVKQNVVGDDIVTPPMFRLKFVLNVPRPGSGRLSRITAPRTGEAKLRKIAFKQGMNDGPDEYSQPTPGNQLEAGRSVMNNKENKSGSGTRTGNEFSTQDNDVPPSLTLEPSYKCLESGVLQVINGFERTIAKFQSLLKEEVLSQYVNVPADGYELSFDKDNATARRGLERPWPDIELLFTEDKVYQQNIADIIDVIRKEMKSVEDISKEYEQYCDMVHDARNIDVEKSMAEKQWSTDQFSAVLGKFTDQLMAMQHMVIERRVGMLQMEIEGFRDACLPFTHRIVSLVKRNLPVVACRRNEALLKVIKNAENKLTKTPANVEEFVEHLNFLSKIAGELSGMEKEYKVVCKLFVIAGNFSVSFESEEWALYQTLTPSFHQLKTTVLYCEANKDESIQKFMKNLQEIVNALYQEVMKLKNRVRNPTLLDEDMMPAAAMENLKLLQEEIALLRERSLNYAEYQEKFGDALSSNLKKRKLKLDPVYQKYSALDPNRPASVEDLKNELSEVERDLTLRQLLWESLGEWDNIIELWEASSFKSLKVEDLQREVTRFVQTVYLLEKGLPPNPVVPKLKQRIMNFRTVMPVISSLRNPSLRPRHWVAIQNVMGTTVVQEKSFTLGHLLTLEILENKDDIAEISSQASNEATLEQMLSRVEEYWYHTDFQLVAHTGREIAVITAADEIFAALDDSLVTLANIRSSRYSVPIKVSVDDWERKLTLFSKCFEEWMLVQRNWLYLETIFSAADIQRQLPNESKLFNQVDRNWKDIMRRTIDRPNALRAATALGVFEILQSCNSNLEKIHRSLEDYLETKRAVFARFYFLSNDELLDILSNTKNHNAVQPHLSKCFGNVQRFEFQKEQNSPPNVAALISGESEYLFLTRSVRVRGTVEQWLLNVESSMFDTVKLHLKKAIQDYQEDTYIEWLLNHPGQVGLTVTLIKFTQNVTEALSSANPECELTKIQEHLVIFLNELAKLVSGSLEQHRSQLAVALIITIVNARDIAGKLIEDRVTSPTDFEWTRNLRYRWDDTNNTCVVFQSTASFSYGYEYLGCSSRLVITPLTNRCYLTLTGALSLNLGGSPVGPAGTGKTETVKDLAKGMGKQCLVFNCSEGLEHKMIAKFLLGLAQSGSWCCFDEFNRIDVEVLSVVAQQLYAIKAAKDASAVRFVFEGRDVRLNSTCGVFITMNPGYAGRVELPDNLKSLFRPVAMVVPDFALITEIILYSEGFRAAATLSRKLINVYELASNQLSQQDHYDFGLRAVKAVLVMAGKQMRLCWDNSGNLQPSIEEESNILITAVRSANIPKFIAEDVLIFNDILRDIFPNVETQDKAYGHLEKAIGVSLRELSLQRWPFQVGKVVQFYDTLLVRHGVMLVGPTGGGKTAVRNILQKALVALPFIQATEREDTKTEEGSIDSEIKNPIGQAHSNKKGIVDATTINPKCVTLGELYGEFNEDTMDWTDGLLSSIVRTFAKKSSKRNFSRKGGLRRKSDAPSRVASSMSRESGSSQDEKSEKAFPEQSDQVKETEVDWHWVVLDGPVDTLWIENLNTVLDETKALCLANGERISLSPSMRMIFEVDDLSQASPATISRCGMIYLDPTDLGWRPFVRSWLNKLREKKVPEHGRNFLHQLFEYSVDPGLQFISKHGQRQYLKAPVLSIIGTTCNILEAFINYFAGSGGFGEQEAQDEGKQAETGELPLSQSGQKSTRQATKRKNYLCQNPHKLTSLFGKLFAFAYIWAFGSNFDSSPDDIDDVYISSHDSAIHLPEEVDVRQLFDTFVRELFDAERSFNVRLPTGKQPVFNYYVDCEKDQFTLWQNLVPSSSALIEKALAHRFAISDAYNELDDPSPSGLDIGDRGLIPTPDTVRFAFILSLLSLNGNPVLLCGENGVGKSYLIYDTLKRLSQEGGAGVGAGTILGSVLASGSSNILDSIIHTTSEKRLSEEKTVTKCHAQFSAQTTTGRTRTLIEDKLVKTGKNSLGSKSGNKVLVFLDDINVSQPETYGAQPPLELLRQLLSMSGYFDPEKLAWKEIQDVTLICACSPPGGGRYALSPRLLRHFSVLCLPQPSVKSLQHIYQTKLGCHLESKEFSADVKSIRGDVVACILGIYYKLVTKLRPTPSKCHYLFNLRDVTKVFDSLLTGSPNSVKSKEQFIELLAHETTRVFYDRLVDEDERLFFGNVVISGFRDILKYKWRNEHGSPHSLLFGDFTDVNSVEKERSYICIRDKRRLQQTLEDYRDRATFAGKDSFTSLVFFPEAVLHVVRACRVLRQQSSHMLLIGVGGSGKALIAQLAAYMQYGVFIRPKLSRNYSLNEFLEDIKKAYYSAGIDGKKTVLFLSDRNIVKEHFLEYVCAILTSGEIPDLFDHDDKERLALALRKKAMSHGIKDNQEDIYQFFLSIARNKLHLMLSTSPSGSRFRERCRTYPAIVNYCTIDWYDEWSEEALLAVAQSSLNSVVVDDNETTNEQLRNNIAIMLKSIHVDIETAAKQFREEVQRHFFTTPRSFLGLTEMFKTLYDKKKYESGYNQDRLATGLRKLSESNELVSTMQKELILLGPQLEQQAKLTEEILAQLARDQEGVDKVRAVVQKEEEVTDRETQKVEQAAEQAQRDLSSVLPQVEAAVAALDALDKSDIAEIRVYSKPPTMVMTVLSAVCILLEQKPDWSTAKLLLGDPGFLKRLVSYDRNSITDKTYAKLKRITKHPDFTPTAVGKISSACKSMCQWVLALQHYTEVYRMVEPRQRKCEEAQAALALARENLRQKKEALAEVQEQLQTLKSRYDESVDELDQLKQRKELTIVRLERASVLIKALENEETRWAKAIEELRGRGDGLIGDALLSAGAVAYLGVFSSSYRQRLLDTWIDKCRSLEIPFSADFNIVKYLTDQVQIQKWNSYNLPSDKYSIENAIFIKFSHRWPYIIDPQEQALKWILEMEKSHGLKTCKAGDSNLIKVLEDAIRLGLPVLLEDAKETFDPALDPILNRNVIVKNNQAILMLGESEIVYNDKFRLYILSKINNPHLLPEDCTKINMINFIVTFDALRDQLLSHVVREERPDLEKQRTSLLERLVNDRIRLRQLEDRTLDLLHAAKGNLLDDEELIETLDRSKQMASTIQERVEASEETTTKMNKSRSIYTPVAHRGAILYTVVADFALVDVMYQFSLAWFKGLFSKCIAPVNKESDNLPQHRGSVSYPEKQRLTNVRHSLRRTSIREYRDALSLEKYLQMMIEFITQTFYRVVSHSLFARHQLLFSFYLSCKILLHGENKEIDQAEWIWLLQGKRPMIIENSKSRSSTLCSEDDLVAQPKRKGSMKGISMDNWKEVVRITEFLPSFAGLANHITMNQGLWQQFLCAEDPIEFLETNFKADTKGDPDKAIDAWCPSKLTRFQRLIVVKALRPEFLLEALRNFVVLTMGGYFVDPPGFDLRELFEQSAARTPLIFILSPGSDPSSQLLRFAKEVRGSSLHLDLVSLGRGQGVKAEELIRKAYSQYGRWIFLQNCHLAGSFMPKLQDIVREILDPNVDIDPHFRLWLSSKPHSDFPASILQSGLKMTVEPPPGLKANLKRSFAHVGGIIPEGMYEDEANGHVWTKLVFGLCLFHAVVQERKKFGSLGWNVPYDFVVSDLEVAVLTLRGMIQDSHDIPWAALRLLTGEIIYGGRVSNQWDQRCLLSILDLFYGKQALFDEYQYSKMVSYRPPSNLTSFNDCMDYIESLPAIDPPDVFGMHTNADQEYSKGEARSLLASLTKMQPRLRPSQRLQRSSDEVVFEVATDIIRVIPRCLQDAFSLSKRNQSSLSGKATSSAVSTPARAISQIQDKDGCQERPVTTNGLDSSAFSTFLHQEQGYYDRLLDEIHSSILTLLSALKGEVVMSEKSETIYDSLLHNYLPKAWQHLAYPSALPLGSWVSNLLKRVNFVAHCLELSQILSWSEAGDRSSAGTKLMSLKPYAYWLPGFFFPQGFLTSVLQAHARQFDLSIDSLSYAFKVTEERWTVDTETAVTDITMNTIAFKPEACPDVGVLVFGLFLDGAEWNFESRALAECQPKHRFCTMPMIHFIPKQLNSDDSRDTLSCYECPLYRTSTRASSLARTSHAANFVTSIFLTTLIQPEHWIRRGVAMLCELGQA